MKRRDVLQVLSAWAGAFLLPTSAMSMKSSSPILAVTDGLAPQPFHINIDKGRIKDLHYRLDHMIWPEMPFDTGWSAGTNDKVLKDLVQYWRHEYDWYKEQEKLNQLRHFTVPIEGEQLHYVQYKGEGKKKRFPLLLLHGWPSSFLEFTQAAPLLVKEGFDVVVPSLPGFVFSEVPRASGMHIGRIADRMHKLMRELGYERYGVQGGDWGAVIAVELARKYPNAIAGLHYVFASFDKLPETPRDEVEHSFIDRQKQFKAEETAYFQIQSTKPQTLAYALQDSPVGLLAWILEKYWGWTDHGEDLWKELPRDVVLNTVMLYWLSGRVLSAARIYYETTHMLPEDWSKGPVPVPTAYARFPKEPWNPPRSLANSDWTANLVQYTEMPAGGHFPALEEPELYATDVAKFFSKL